ncbi:hypothetical protein SH467x_001844 [Pirellulaceae bacterium SH467]
MAVSIEILLVEPSPPNLPVPDSRAPSLSILSPIRQGTLGFILFNR